MTKTAQKMNWMRMETRHHNSEVNRQKKHFINKCHSNNQNWSNKHKNNKHM